jgi:pimeloyl-ACP methyl ester carboxylesterase
MIVTDFTVSVPAGVLDDLRTRLGRTRLPERTPGPKWSAGTDPDYLRDLLGYWADGFDWHAQERILNGFRHHQVTLDGRRQHFVRVPGVRPPSGPAPIPLLLAHGWPSTFTEMLPLVAPLTDPARHGGDPTDAFDVVIPSLPGIAYSEVPADAPLTRPVIADLWKRLMVDVLGYPRFGLYGGDIGGDVAHWIAIRHPDRVVGLHTIHPKVPATADPDRPPTPAEHAYLREREREDEEDGGYSHLQESRPDTLAAALLDSPSGLAAWIVEKFRAWSDCDGDIERRFSKDALLTIITLYWVTGSIGTSFRTYHDYRHNPQRPLVTVPTGVTLSTEDRGYPRTLADRSYTDIRFWNQPGRGGHFFPLEEPDLLVEDLCTFFRPLRPTSTD